MSIKSNASQYLLSASLCGIIFLTYLVASPLFNTIYASGCLTGGSGCTG